MIKIILKGIKNIKFLAKAFEEALNKTDFSKILKNSKDLDEIWDKEWDYLLKDVQTYENPYQHFINRFNKRV